MSRAQYIHAPRLGVCCMARRALSTEKSSGIGPTSYHIDAANRNRISVNDFAEILYGYPDCLKMMRILYQ